MGNQPKPRPETPKAPPIRPDSEGGLGQGAAPPALEFCLMQHSLRVEFSAKGAISPGDQVRLIAASPPRVLSQGREVGVVRDSLAGAMARCLADDYEMNGVVDLVDLEGRYGQVTVRGQEAG
jgi:hypothetical protein